MFNNGDKFIIEVAYKNPIKNECDDEHFNSNYYKIKNIARQFSETELTRLKKYDNHRVFETYAKGLNDMLNAVRKIYNESDNDGLTVSELIRIFGTSDFSEIITDNSSNDIVREINNYEKEQLEIRVGDEVEGKEVWLKGVVTFVDDESGRVDVLCKNGKTAVNVSPSYLRKTCRHFQLFDNIEKLFEKNT